MPLTTADLPSALERLDQIRQRAAGKQLAVFLDYDGTLTPIVQRPELAVFPKAVKEIVQRIARRVKVAILSGRDLDDVRRLVGMENIFYAGSHGFEIAGPGGWHLEARQATEFVPSLDRAEQALHEYLDRVAGVLVERKRFSVAVHYRLVKPGDLARVKRAVEKTIAAHPDLRLTAGKKVYELRPACDWHKGKALLWLLDALELNSPSTLPIFIGDDITDEDAFEALDDRGIGVVVRSKVRPTAAIYALEDTEQVRRFLEALARLVA